MHTEKWYTEKEYAKTYKYVKQMITDEKYKEEMPVQPAAALLGGQPGAGKSYLTSAILEENENMVVIDGDYIRQFHPHLEQIQKEFGADYPKETQPFVNRAVEQLIDELSKEHYNLVIEGTLRDISVPLKTAGMLDKRGYIIDLYVIATDKGLSWQSTISRGDKMKEHGEIPRYVDKAHHDKVVASLPDAVKCLAENELFNNVIIMNRNKEILYSKEETPGLNPKEIMERALSGEKVMGINDEDRDEEAKSVDDLIVEAKNEISNNDREEGPVKENVYNER